MGRSKTCIVCDEKLKDEEKYVKYELRSNTDRIGEFFVHKKLDCFERGSTILRKQIDGSSYHNHTVITTHIGTNYVFKIVRNKDGFAHALMQLDQYGGSTPDKQMFDFLKKFVAEKDMLFIHLKNLEGTPEYGIPMLVYNKDPILPSEFLESYEYKKIVKDAREEYDLAMKIRGQVDIEAITIMSAYAISTSITI